MAHFAKLDENNKVVKVIAVNNIELLDEEGVEREELGIQFCQNLFGGNWIQTSYHANFRKNFAASGYTYDSELDAFIIPKPYDSWVLNEETCQWEPPVAYPEGDGKYNWDEETTSWVLEE